MTKALILTLIPTLYFAQVKTEVEVFNNSRGSVFDVKNTNIKSYQGIDGSPYFNEAFLPITVEGYSKYVPNVRYNAYEDEMEYQNGDILNYVVKAGDMRITFTGSGKTYVLENYTLDGKEINGYLVELIRATENKAALYKKEQIDIMEYNNNTTNTYLKQQNPKFEKSKDLLLVYFKGNFFKLPKNNKELQIWLRQNLFLSNTGDAENFVKKNKMNFSKEEDVKKFIQFLNS